MAFSVNPTHNRERIALPTATNFPSWIKAFGIHIAQGPVRKTTHRYMIMYNKPIETRDVVVHTFIMSDVDDPDLMAAEPLWKWQQSEQGQWVMSNSLVVPIWNRMVDSASFGHKYHITATFDTKRLTEYYLRFGNTEKKSI